MYSKIWTGLVADSGMQLLVIGQKFLLTDLVRTRVERAIAVQALLGIALARCLDITTVLVSVARTDSLSECLCSAALAGVLES